MAKCENRLAKEETAAQGIVIVGDRYSSYDLCKLALNDRGSREFFPVCIYPLYNNEDCPVVHYFLEEVK